MTPRPSFAAGAGCLALLSAAVLASGARAEPAVMPLPSAPSSTPASAPVPALPSPARAEWTFTHADGTVHHALSRWAREAGWQLVWEVDRDFPIDAEVTLRGDFAEALRQAMSALHDTDFPLQARLQPASRVVRIGRFLPEGARQ
jgi:hypothetical protein